MIYNDEKHAPTQKVEGDEARLLRVLLSPGLQGYDESIAAGFTILPPGSHSDLTGHEEGELFYVISGEGKIFVDGETKELYPTASVWTPPYKVHQLINDSDQELKILWILNPAGREANIIAAAK